jgi:hypothetical protein
VNAYRLRISNSFKISAFVMFSVSRTVEGRPRSHGSDSGLGEKRDRRLAGLSRH